MKWARVQLEWPQKQLKSLSQTNKMTLDDKVYHTLAAYLKVEDWLSFELVKSHLVKDCHGNIAITPSIISS